jgi:hypothetical protein
LSPVVPESAVLIDDAILDEVGPLSDPKESGSGE